MRERVRHLRDSLQIDQLFVRRAKAFLLWQRNGDRSPRETRQADVAGFLAMLATE